MNVLFLMFVFPNQDRSFNMYTTIVKQFAENGHHVLTIAPSQQNEQTGIYKEDGVEILRVRTLSIKNVANWRKGLANLLLPYQYKRALNRFCRDTHFDLIVLPTPPITLAQLAASLKKRNQAKVYLILRDIFPQNAVDLGFMKKGTLVYRLFSRKEQQLYKTADRIGCMSTGNIEYVMHHNPEISPDKLHILSNFQYLYEKKDDHAGLLRKKYGIEGKYVIVFGGNMGKPQRLENVLELARRAMEYPNVIFLLLGEGVMMQRIKKITEDSGITNIKIESSISKREYQDLLNACDVGLISLHEDFTIPNIPSKSLDYWNVGLPILASIDRATDFGKILDQSRSGLWSYAGDHEQFFENFKRLYEDKKLRTELAQNGRAYFAENLTPEIAYESIINQL